MRFIVLTLFALMFVPLGRVSATTTPQADTVSTTITTVASTDSDKDGLSDALEEKIGTDVHRADTDNDGYSDGNEVFTGYNPWVGNRNRKVIRRAEVDLSNQRLYLYFNNVKMASIPISTGLRRTPTPKGEFEVLRKPLYVNYIGTDYNYPKTKWNLMFKNRYYLHGAYWHNQFGKRPMSHGCVNIAYKDAEKVYQFLDVGDPVKIYGITPVGLIAQR